MKPKKLTIDDFIERVKNKKSVSRFKFELDFKWDAENSKKLRSADLSSADLSSADLSFANLSSADLSFANLSFANLSSADFRYADLRLVKGEFIFNFGVKLKVEK